MNINVRQESSSHNNTHSAHVPSSESGDEWHGAGRLAVACTAHTGSFLVCCSCQHPYSQRAAIHYTHTHSDISPSIVFYECECKQKRTTEKTVKQNYVAHTDNAVLVLFCKECINKFSINIITTLKWQYCNHESTDKLIVTCQTKNWSLV